MLLQRKYSWKIGILSLLQLASLFNDICFKNYTFSFNNLKISRHKIMRNLTNLRKNLGPKLRCSQVSPFRQHFREQNLGQKKRANHAIMMQHILQVKYSQ